MSSLALCRCKLTSRLIKFGRMISQMLEYQPLHCTAKPADFSSAGGGAVDLGYARALLPPHPTATLAQLLAVCSHKQARRSLCPVRPP